MYVDSTKGLTIFRLTLHAMFGGGDGDCDGNGENPVCSKSQQRLQSLEGYCGIHAWGNKNKNVTRIHLFPTSMIRSSSPLPTDGVLYFPGIHRTGSERLFHVRFVYRKSTLLSTPNIQNDSYLTMYLLTVKKK